MHNASVCASNRSPYHALFGRQPHLLPPLEGGYHGDLDIKGQNNIVRVREIAAIATILGTAKQRLLRGDERNQVVARERGERQPDDLVDIWYDLRNEDAPGWRAPAQIAFVNDGERGHHSKVPR